VLQCVAGGSSVTGRIVVPYHLIHTTARGGLARHIILCVAVCCSVLQCVAVCVAVCCSVLKCVAVCAAVYCTVLQCVSVCAAVCCTVL